MSTILVMYGDRVDAAADSVDRMMEQYHSELRDAGVTVSVLMASAETDEHGEPVGGPAVTAQGYPCEAKIQVTPYRYRVLSVADAQITVDADIWDILTNRQRDALIDHELTHLELSVDDSGAVVRDDCERPKMRIRKHDRVLGAFDSVVCRHGESSPEHRQWEAIAEAKTQQWLFAPEVDEELEDDDGSHTNVTTRDGRKITVKQMIGEIERDFARKT